MALRGVNLGGWLVLEKWMTPSLFAETPAIDEYSLCLNASKSTLQQLKQHRDSFITLQDFKWLQQHGIDAVRLPIGYWCFGDESPYQATINYIDKAFEWAKQTGLKILLDFHGAPGSQNGQDHSGRSGAIEWAHNEQNILKSLAVLRRLAERYGNHPNLLGIELLNEPNKKLPNKTLLPFYETAYKMIRDTCGDELWIVFSDSFKPKRWKRKLKTSKHSNIYIDTHQYQLFTAKDKRMGVKEHLEKTLNKVPKNLQKMQRHHPVVVGEWSMALDNMSLKDLNASQRLAALQAYGQLQLLAFEQISAWFYWSYKTENSDAWNFRDCIETGRLRL